jgi:competence protein ComFC
MILKPLLSDLKTFILDILFPITCFGCEKEGKYICAECRTKLTPTHQICIGCKKLSLAGLTHPKCQSPQTPDQLLSFFDYKDSVVSSLIIKGKYYFIQDIFSEFGEIIAEKINKDYPELLSADSYKLLAIPLHKSRLRWRGFNQSETFAKTLADKLNLPIANFLIRSKPTKTQKDLKREQRIKNIESAFTISPPSIGGVDPFGGRGGIKNKSYILNHQSYILLDDVTTTGSTLLEATKVLKRNGAKKVICLTIARD